MQQHRGCSQAMIRARDGLPYVARDHMQVSDLAPRFCFGIAGSLPVAADTIATCRGWSRLPDSRRTSDRDAYHSRSDQA